MQAAEKYSNTTNPGLIIFVEWVALALTLVWLDKSIEDSE